MNFNMMGCKTAAAAIIAFGSLYLGGFDELLRCLLILIVADYVTGWAAAFIKRELSSDIGFRGIIKKVVILVIVAVSYALDQGFNVPAPGLRSIVISFYILNEGLSIIENADHMGLKIPAKLADFVRSALGRETP